MRCMAIAAKLASRGVQPIFIVSSEESRAFVGSRGYHAEMMTDDPFSYSEASASRLAGYCSEFGANVLIDSYGVNELFFRALRERCSSKIAYIDDLFTYAHGIEKRPIRYSLDLVNSYSFYANESEYESAYAGSDTKLFIGPVYAPVRDVFCGGGYVVKDDVRNVLITTGSTNPDRMLEKIVKLCAEALRGVEFDVVVGPLAEYSGSCKDGVKLFEDPSDIARLMKSSDLVISAGGTTLYELSAVGVPTLAFPMVENQIRNVIGFADRGLGIALPEYSESTEGVWKEHISSIAVDLPGRKALSGQMGELFSAACAQDEAWLSALCS